MTMRSLVSALALILCAALLPAATVTASAEAATSPLSARAASSLKPGAWQKRILKQTNKHRKKHGCKKLKNNKKLRKAARKHSKRMAKSRTLSHQLPGEPPLGTRITRAGYRNWRGVAENIAYGYGSPKAMVKAWMKSPGHRKNILNCRYRHLGVGVILKGGVPWATQNFGHK